MTKLDIKDAYHPVPIFEGDQKLLKFKFRDQFLTLPNSDTKEPRKFTKLVKPILAKLRKQNSKSKYHTLWPRHHKKNGSNYLEICPKSNEKR